VGGAATVTDLCESIGLPAGVAGLVLVNGVHAEAGTPLHDGDEVSLFPPVGGG
jgi:molybdopterin converting factor small subunit